MPLYVAYPYKATGGTVARTSPDRFADRISIKDFGAVGNGVADDSIALAAAVAYSNTVAATGRPPLLYAPTGTYSLKTVSVPTFIKGGGIVGDGPNKTIFVVDGAWPAGDVFSWSEAWYDTNFPSEGPTVVSLTNHKTGPIARGFGIIGTTVSGNVHNGLCLYDHCDEPIFEDVNISYLTGRGLYLGGPLNTPTRCYTREGMFINIRVACCGSATLPSVEIASVGDNVDGTDATDACTFVNLAIFACKGGGGLVIRNTRIGVGTNVGIRTLRFFGLRVEGVFSPADAAFTGDLIRIGDPAYTGRIYDIEIHGLVAAASYTGFSTLKMDAADLATAPFGISVEGVITSGAGGGINIQRGRLLKFEMLDIGTTGTKVTVGQNAGPNIIIDGHEGETVWSNSIHATAKPFVKVRTLTQWVP